MTTIAKQTAHCPICNHQVTISIIMSTNTFGGQDMDFRTRPAGSDPLHSIISRCNQCGYCDYGQYFKKPREMSETLKARIREHTQSQADEVTTSAKYITAAQIGELRGDTPEVIANLYLRAAWCCNDKDDFLGEINCRKSAIIHFEAALDDDPPPRDHHAITYLIGELYRRIGDTDMAHIWFERVIASDDGSEQSAKISDIARQQRDNPRNRF